MAELKTIRELREERGWTLQELADRTGVNMQMVYQWESGRRGITARNLRAISRVLGVSMDDIALPGDDE